MPDWVHRVQQQTLAAEDSENAEPFGILLGVL